MGSDDLSSVMGSLDSARLTGLVALLVSLSSGMETGGTASLKLFSDRQRAPQSTYIGRKLVSLVLAISASVNAVTHDLSSK